MPEEPTRPLNWQPDPDIGYQVIRRLDGGMHYTFTDVSHQTLAHWREFALEHLLNSDRLTRNLYDLRQLENIPHEAIQYALEISSDPSARHVRTAVVVANLETLQAVEEIFALTIPGGVEMAIFTDLDEAEAWLDRPLTQLA
ncbi:MAG: hypothetical protein P8Z00_19110 [Anaerolineales bacterium]|jgi:hypothetical protein